LNKRIQGKKKIEDERGKIEKRMTSKKRKGFDRYSLSLNVVCRGGVAMISKKEKRC
jgi:hypothetical protein